MDDKRKKIIDLLERAVKLMDDSRYHYFIVAGKDGIMSRYLRGDDDELGSMTVSFMKDHPAIGKIIKENID